MQKVMFIIAVIFLMTQLFAHIYLTAWEKDGDKKTGWQRVGWHVLITLSFTVFLIGCVSTVFVLADFSLSKFSAVQLLPIFLTYCIWFIVAYVGGGIVQGIRNGTLFAD